MNLQSWPARVAIVAGFTYLAYRFLPVGSVGKTIVLAIGGVSAAGIMAAHVPLLGAAVTGQLPGVTTGTAST